MAHPVHRLPHLPKRNTAPGEKTATKRDSEEDNKGRLLIRVARTGEKAISTGPKGRRRTDSKSDQERVALFPVCNRMIV